MKALTVHAFDALASASIEEVPLPAPRSGEVLVRVVAAAINPLDVKILAGLKQAVFPVAFPFTPGTDVAGVITTVGDDSHGFLPGDRVAGRTDPRAGGALAEYVVVPASTLCHVPKSVELWEAAAMPTAAGTARQALFSAGKLASGQRVLIHAGAGGVGSFAVQLAKQAGAYVIATASTVNLSLVTSLGADEVIDRRNEDFSQAVQDVDLVLDTVGGDTLERSWQTVKAGGLIVSIVDPTIKPRGEVAAVFTTIRHEPSELCSLLLRVEARTLNVQLDSTYTLATATDALKFVAGGHAAGKVLVRVSE